MKDKPYVYTMPESFLADQNVPARWRILAVLNGFLLNGRHFYGSNSWLMEQLNCSQQTVSSAIAELEKLGEIKVDRTASSRIIKRIMQEGGTSQLVGGYKPAGRRGTNQLVPTSDSNSENIIQGSENFSSSRAQSQDSKYELRDVDEEGMVAPVKPVKMVAPKDESFSILAKVKEMIEKDTGTDIILGDTALKSIKRALQYIASKDILIMVEDALADGSAEKRGFTMHYILSDSNINKYKAENT